MSKSDTDQVPSKMHDTMIKSRKKWGRNKLLGRGFHSPSTLLLFFYIHHYVIPTIVK